MTTLNLWIVLAIIWVHWFADFFCQTDKMAKGKSTSNKWLGYHISVYTAILMVFGWKYALINGVLHAATDYVTSRITSRLWKEQRVHDFFVVIGVDQAIHATCLLLTIPLMGW